MTKEKTWEERKDDLEDILTCESCGKVLTDGDIQHVDVFMSENGIECPDCFYGEEDPTFNVTLSLKQLSVIYNAIHDAAHHENKEPSGNHDGNMALMRYTKDDLIKQTGVDGMDWDVFDKEWISEFDPRNPNRTHTE